MSVPASKKLWRISKEANGIYYEIKLDGIVIDRIKIEEPVPTEISQRGIDFIKQYEGFIPVATRLAGEQYMTLGFGHYGSDVKEGQTITEEQANELLKADLKGYTDLVLKHCSYLDLNQAQVDSLTSFTYNCGFGNLKKLTANGIRTEKEIAEHITAYTKSKSEVNRNGLQKRRQAEKLMFEEGL
jgi:GH24 family phage-related lysozyme (muramidase)